MDYGEIAKNVLLSAAMVKVYAIAGGVIVSYVFSNYVDKPAVKSIALEVAEEVEKQTKEGTPEDIFLDKFIKNFKKKKGRKPNAGEIKTAVDLKDQKFGIEFSKDF